MDSFAKTIGYLGNLGLVVYFTWPIILDAFRGRKKEHFSWHGRLDVTFGHTALAFVYVTLCSALFKMPLVSPLAYFVLLPWATFTWPRIFLPPKPPAPTPAPAPVPDTSTDQKIADLLKKNRG